MTEQEVIEGEVQEQATDLVPIKNVGEDFALMPVMDLAKAKQRYDQMVGFVKEIMRDGVDHGTIPGTQKPTLYKPGAEKLATFFGLRKTFELQDKIEVWDEDSALFFYRYKSLLWRGDMLIAEGIGSASSREDRYRWRWVSEDKIPAHLKGTEMPTRGGKASEFDFAVKESRTEGQYAKPAEYWQRFTSAIEDESAKSILKKAKSGKEYEAWEIDSTYFRVPNPDVFTLVNTIDKMGQKRAFVQAVLIGVNASEFFTQDVEDMPIETLSGQEDRYTPPPEYDDFNKEFPKKENEKSTNGQRPYPAEIAREKIESFYDHKEFKGRKKNEKRGEKMTLTTAVVLNLNKCFEGNPDPDKDRHTVLGYISRGEASSIKDEFWTGAKLCAIEKWLEVKEWEGQGAGWTPRKESRLEAASMVVTRMKEQGQQELL